MALKNIMKDLQEEHIILAEMAWAIKMMSQN